MVSLLIRFSTLLSSVKIPADMIKFFSLSKLFMELRYLVRSFLFIIFNTTMIIIIDTI